MNVKPRVILTKNMELDRIMGGVPIPSVTLIEGENDTGKSLLAYHLAIGALSMGLTARYITTETTVKGLVAQMSELCDDVIHHFIMGRFSVTAVHTEKIRWDERVAKYYLAAILNFVKSPRGAADFTVIDSITYVAAHAEEKDILSFFSELMRYTYSSANVAIITIHPFAFSEELLVRIRSACDGHILLHKKILRGSEIVRTLEVAKMKGAPLPAEKVVFFKVRPRFGIKVIPVSQVRA